jgi:hypothetical protein
MDVSKDGMRAHPVSIEDAGAAARAFLEALRAVDTAEPNGIFSEEWAAQNASVAKAARMFLAAMDALEVELAQVGNRELVPEEPVE